MIEGCPIMSNPLVAREFNELKDAVGEKAAYAIWSLNNGYGIDKAPNGEPSILFLSLLDNYGGDRLKAIEAKAKTYSKSFRNWFGDWTLEDRTNVSKVVDSNGEPLIVWHSSNNYFEEFNNQLGSSNTNAKDGKLFFFFMKDRNGSSWYSWMGNNIDKTHSGFNISSFFKNHFNGMKSIFTYTMKYPFDKYIEELRFTVYNNGMVFNDEGYLEGTIEDLKGDIISSTSEELYDDIRKDIGDKMISKEELDLYKDASDYQDMLHSSYDEDAGTYLDKDWALEEKIEKLFIRPFYLNIKNIEDASEVKDENNVKHSVSDYYNGNNDGIIVKNVIDSVTQSELTDIYAVKNPNQIKSIDNQGTFSKEDNNIYFNLDSEDPIYQLISKETLGENEHNLIYKNHGPRVTKAGMSSISAKEAVKRALSRLGFDTDVFDKDGELKQDKIKKDKTSKSILLIKKIVDFLEEKFPNLECNVISDVQARRILKSEYQDGVRSFVKGGKVYIIEGKFTEQSTIEEFLHPLVKILISNNTELADNLFEQAKKDFPELYREILSTYTNKKGFTEEDRKNELVTLTLSRYFLKEFNESEHKSLSDTIHQFLSWLTGMINSLFSNGVIDSEGVVKLANVNPNMTFELFAKLINASDVKFVLDNTEEVLFNLLNNPNPANFDKAIDDILSVRQEILNAIHDEEEVYVNEYMYDFNNNNPSATADEKRQAEIDARHQFHRKKIDETNDIIYKKLLDELPIDDSSTGKAREQFLKHFYQYMEDERNANTIMQMLWGEILGVDVTSNVRPVVEAYLNIFQTSSEILNALRVLDDGRGISTPKLLRELADIIEGKLTTGKKTRIAKKALKVFTVPFNGLMKLTFSPIGVGALTGSLFGGPISTAVGAAVGLGVQLYVNNKNKKEDGVTDKEREHVIKDVIRWFTHNEELGVNASEQVVYDMSLWTIHGDEIAVKEKDVMRTVKKGIESRIKAIKSVAGNTNSQDLQFLEDWLAVLNNTDNLVEDRINDRINNNLLDPDDKEAVKEAKKLIKAEIQLTQIADFLSKGILEMIKLSTRLTNILNNDVSHSNYDDLMLIKNDILGFYNNIVNHYVQLYTDYTTNSEFKVGGAQYNSIRQIRNSISAILVLFNQQLKRYTEYTVDKVADELVDVGNKEMFKLNAKLWLSNQIDNGELAVLELFLGPAVSSKSPIVRILDYFVREANTATRIDTQTKAKKLLELYKSAESISDEILPRNFMRNFCELDEDGKPTGNYVSEYNHGLFEKRKKAIKDKLCKKYIKAGLADLDEESNTLVFHDDADRLSFLDEYDDARYDIGEVRRFLPLYYKDRRRVLSKDTIQRLDSIEEAIHRLESMCVETYEVDGRKYNILIPSKLTSNQRRTLEDLRRSKQQLSNPYEIEFDSNGNIISISEKTGDALRIAEEINKWNQLKRNGIKYTPNFTSYKEVKSLIEAKYGTSSSESKRFEYDYSTRDATDDWYEELSKESTPQSEEVEKLKQKRRAILRAVEIKNGIYGNKYDLSKLNDKAWKELKEIEEELSEIIEHSAHSDEYKEFIKNRTTLINVEKVGAPTRISFLDYEMLRIQKLYPGDDKKLELLFYNKYFYLDAERKEFIPLSVFTIFSPSKASDIIDEKPIGTFSDFDLDKSTYIDDRFDIKDDSYNQLDKTRLDYISEQYKKILKNPRMRRFYDYLIDMNEEAWSMLPNINRGYKYQMPQRRDRNAHLITRLGSPLNALKAIGSNIFTVNENDLEYNEELTTRADGSIVETIPIRWTKRLEDPTMISTDVVGAAVDFYEMACNFKLKQAMASLGEALRLLTMSTNTGVHETDQSERISEYMSTYVYGRKVKPMGSRKKMSKTEQIVTQVLSKLRATTHKKLMAHNFVGIAKNLIDSSSSLIAEVIGGKYYTMSMMLGAMKDMGKEVFNGNVFGILGKTNGMSWTELAMQFNGVSGSMHELYTGHNEYRLRRIVSTHFSMGEYSLVDYSFKGLLTNMVYRSYKLMLNPNTGEYEFMNRERAKYVYTLFGHRNDYKKAFNDAKYSLRDVYYVDGIDKTFKLVPSVTIKGKTINLEDIVRPMNDDLGRRSHKLETRVSGTISERSAVINGMLDDMDRGKLNSNYIGALVMLMRGWMISQQADYSKNGHDFAKFSNDADIMATKLNIIKRMLTKLDKLDGGTLLMIEEDEDYAGLFNFATGCIEKGAWRGLFKIYMKSFFGLRSMAQSSKFTDNQRYQIRRMNACMIAVAILMGLSYFLGKAVENSSGGGDDEWWKILLLQTKLGRMFLYSSVVSGTSERTSQIGYLGFAPTVMDLVNSITVSKSELDDADSPALATMDFVQMTYCALTGGKFSELDAFDEVKTGSYSDIPWWIKENDLLRSSLGIKKNLNKTPKWLRNTMKAMSVTPGINELGVSNIYKNTTMSGLKSKESYYYNKVFPTQYVTYGAQLTQKPKPQHGVFGYLEDKGVIEKLKQIKKPTKKKTEGRTSTRKSTRSSTRKSTR